MHIDGVAAAALSEAEFLERVGGREGSVCVLQLDRDDGGGQSHVVDVSVCRAGVMDEEQLHVPSSYTGEWLASLLFVNLNFFVDTFDTISNTFCRVYRQ